jgi:hypothetical protein
MGRGPCDQFLLETHQVSLQGHPKVQYCLPVHTGPALYKLRVFLSGLICYPPTESNTEDSP